MKRPAFWPGLALQTNQRAHAPLPGMLETENMNADQGFRRTPENLLRAAAGAGAAVLIAAAISAARRVRTATADRDSGSAQDQVSLSDVPAPEVPEAVTAGDPAVGQVAISAALLLVSVTALSAVAGRRRGGGKRGAAHARTSGRQAENGDDVLAPEIPADSGDPWITGAPWSGHQEPAWHDADQSWYDGLRGQHTDDYPSWPGRPGPAALHSDHPSWGGGRTDPRWDSAEAALRQDGYPSWPESAAPPWPDAESPAANDGSGWRGGGRPARQEPPPAPYRGPDGRPAAGQSATGPRRVSSAAGLGPDPRLASAGYAPRPGPSHRAG